MKSTSKLNFYNQRGWLGSNNSNPLAIGSVEAFLIGTPAAVFVNPPV